MNFPRLARLTLKRDFSFVFEDPCKVSAGSFTILARRNELSHPRLGMAISKKNAKTAVSRNRIKRMVRESFRVHYEQLGDFDIVVLTRRGVMEQSKQQLSQSLEKQWNALVKRCAASLS